MSKTQPTPPPPTPTPTPDPLRARNALLLGYVGGTHDGGSLTDTMILAHLDPKNKTVTLISLPRDLWVSIPLQAEAPREGKINSAYAIGNDTRSYSTRDESYTGKHAGLALAKAVVSQVTGEPIEFAVATSMQGFLSTFNTLGPLEVDVPYTFTDEFYPILSEENNPCEYSPEDIASISAAFKGFELEKQFPCRYETLSFTKGPTVLDAETALKFVRSRHSGTGSGDFGRIQRQQAVLKAIERKLTTPSSIASLVPLISQLYKAVESDFGLDDLLTFLQAGAVQSGYTVVSVSLDTTNVLEDGRSSDGQYILRPKSLAAPTPNQTSTTSAADQPTPSPDSDPWQVVREFVQASLIITPTPTTTSTTTQ